jgi:hypothetical protein
MPPRRREPVKPPVVKDPLPVIEPVVQPIVQPVAVAPVPPKKQRPAPVVRPTPKPTPAPAPVASKPAPPVVRIARKPAPRPIPAPAQRPVRSYSSERVVRPVNRPARRLPNIVDATPVENEVPPSLVQLGLVPLEGQGKRGDYTGTVLKVGLFSQSPTLHRLVKVEGKRKTTVCFVMGNKQQMISLEGSVIAVAGREYWVRGEDYPVLKIERILMKERKVVKTR